MEGVTTSPLLTSAALPTTAVQWAIICASLAITLLHLYRSRRRAEPALKSRLKRRMSTLGWATKETETDSNRSIPLSITIMDGDLSMETLGAHLQSRMTEDPTFFFRFVSRVDHGMFVADPAFDAMQHLSVHVLGADETPHDVAESLANKALDETRPLWAVTIMHYKAQTWLVWRIHHCIGDGASLAMAFLKFSDAKCLPAPPAAPATAAPKPPKTPFYVIWAQIAWSVYLYGRKVVGTVVFPEPRTVLKHHGTQRKRLGYTLDFNIAETKAVGKHFGATLNDVLVSCIAGALRKTIEASAPATLTPSLSLRAGIPVNMRGASASIDTTSNDFSSLLVDLPVGEPNATHRMKTVVKRMKEAKFSLEKNFTKLLSIFMMSLPRDLMRHCVHWSASNVTIAITNVRGPPIDIFICGHKMAASYAFVPPPPSVNVGVAITSWGSSLGVTVLTDTSVPQSPQFIIAAIEAEFQALRAGLKMD